MAKAFVAQTVTEVSLDLNMEETYFLFDVLSRIGGHPDFSRRKHAQSIIFALHKAIPDELNGRTSATDIIQNNAMHCSLYFQDIKS